MKKVSLIFVIIVSSILGFAQSVNIGDILCTDGSTVRPEQFASSGKTADGIVFYVDGDENYGWAVSLECQAVNTDWVTSEHYGDMYDIPMLDNFEYSREAMYDLDGYNNTDIIRSTHGADWYPAAWCVDFDHGWYLPAAGQMRWLMAYINEINASLSVVHGTMFVYDHPRWYWTSTERTGAHAIVISQTGAVGNYMKWNYIGEYEIGVRAIKTFTIQNQSHHIGEVVTTPSGQKGVVFYVSPEDGAYWLVAMNDLPSTYIWGTETDIPDLYNYNANNQFVILHGVHCGYDATFYMREAMGTASQYASSHVDFANGWHIPSVGQLSKLYAALPNIEAAFSNNGGTTLSGDYYWTSTECSASSAWAINFGANLQNEGLLKDYSKTSQFPVRPVWSESCMINEPPTVGSISTPEPICANDSLILQIPETQHATSQGWQLSPTPDFSEPVIYDGEPIGFDHNGWYLRYFASNAFDTVYSNTVIISVWPTYATSFNITSCTDYTWNGITYTQPGVYEQTLSTVHGCDSVVTLNLSMDSINKREVFMTGCDSIAYNGIVYTQSGHYEQLVPGSTGCDTIIELFLNIRYTPYVSQIHGETFIYYAESGEFIYSIDPVEGCYGYEWRIDNDWPLITDFNSPECTLSINHASKGTLTVRVYTECGFVERSLTIKHDTWPWIVVWPNPSNGEFNLGLYGMKGEAVIEVYNYLGQRIDRFSVDTDMEGTTIPYSLSGKAAGVYILAVTHNHRLITKKVVKTSPALYGVPIW